MERDKSPTRTVKIPTQKEHMLLHNQRADEEEKERMKEQQVRMNFQRERIATLLNSSKYPLNYVSEEPCYIRNELILDGWHVEGSHVDGEADGFLRKSYTLEYLETDPIVGPSPGRMLDAVNDEEIEQAIKAADMDAHHDVANEINYISSVLSGNHSTFEYTKLSDKTKKILAKAGYTCVELHMFGSNIAYRIIPKEQYDRVKAKLAKE